ncbi:hypothetical protein [Streptomyces sp. NPDC046759]|uniref:hypothetical protein n=1 Tax=Streptomyces sp. NPDC046759 TaxID=3155019 RepID=UPI0033CE6F6E
MGSLPVLGLSHDILFAVVETRSVDKEAVVVEYAPVRNGITPEGPTVLVRWKIGSAAFFVSGQSPGLLPDICQHSESGVAAGHDVGVELGALRPVRHLVGRLGEPARFVSGRHGVLVTTGGSDRCGDLVRIPLLLADGITLEVAQPIDAILRAEVRLKVAVTLLSACGDRVHPYLGLSL